MDLRQLYHAQDKLYPMRDLRTAAANAMWVAEITERFETFKAELKRLGYTSLRVGEHERWKGAHGNMVFAEPPTRIHGRVALWQDACDLLGGMGCGNGHDTYDQAQLSLPSEAFEMFKGAHTL